MEIKNMYELIALNKALTFLRFECREYEVQYIAGSPLIKDIHLVVMDNLRELYKKDNIIMPNDFGFIEDNDAYLQTIITTIKNIASWTALSEHLKKDHVNNLISPYKIKDDTLKYLINYT